MDLTFALIAGALIIAIAIGVIAVIVGIYIGKRRRGDSRVRQAQGDFQPPEPPGGR